MAHLTRAERAAEGLPFGTLTHSVSSILRSNRFWIRGWGVGVRDAGCCVRWAWTVCRLTLVLLGLAAAPHAAGGQARHPRVALVLGGGGARGAAHIGVLRALDELRVPVDLVVGTSMGAVVGGLFAAGLTDTEIEREATSIDWADVFSGSPPRDDLNYRRKQEDLTLPVQLELGLRRGRLHLPRGLVTGQDLSTLLSALTLPIGPVHDFDDLPVPFRAVATDIGSGEMVVLESGDLAEAIRASMAVPGMFIPIELDGRLLVDGGLRNNLPIDVALRWNPDVIIAVDVATPPLERTELVSALAIGQQAMRFPIQGMTIEQTERLRPGQDVLLRPQLDSVQFTSFEAIPAGVRAGQRAVVRAATTLRHYSLGVEEYAAWKRRRTEKPSMPLAPEFVRIENHSRMASSALRRALGVDPRRPLDVGALVRGLDRIYGMGSFESVRVRWSEEDDALGLVVEVVPEPWGPNYVRFGISLRDDLGGSSAFDVLVNYTATQLNGWGGELRNELQVGRRRRVLAELYQPLGARSRLFVAPRLSWSRTLAEVFTGPVRIGQFRRTEWGAGLDGGIELGNWGEARVGWWFGGIDVDRRTGPVDSTTAGPHVSALQVALGVDRLDDRGFPTRGETYRVELVRPVSALGGDATYARLSLYALKAATGAQGTVLARARVATSLGSSLPYWDAFELGGFLDLSGLQPRQQVGSELAQVGLTFYRPLATFPTTLAGGRMFLGASVEAGNTWSTASAVSLDRLRVGGAVFAGLETFLGPAWLGYGRADRGEGAWYLAVGRTF
ncbi:MAG: patatin-like phospholipase family protein [Gemmatimonadota bacterium]